MKSIYFFFLLLFTITSCTYLTEDATFKSNSTRGYKPIYATDDEWKAITFSDPIEYRTLDLGKFHYKNNHIYTVEKEQGVLIIDNTTPSDPQVLKYMNIGGADELVIKGDLLYINQYTDLIAINIADLDNIFIESRVEGLYPITEQSFPEGRTGSFECADPDKGTVVAWIYTDLESPQCRR